MDMDMTSGVRGPDRAPSEPRVTIFTLHSVSYLDDPWIQRTWRISGSRTPGGETAGYPAGHVLIPRCPRGVGKETAVTIVSCACRRDTPCRYKWFKCDELGRKSDSRQLEQDRRDT